MFNGLHSMPPAAAELATQALAEEGKYKFPSFSAADALALVGLNFWITRLYSDAMRDWKGLSLRKRFRASARHLKGKGLVISIQTIAGHILFACTVGDLANGIGDVSLDSWACLEEMINTVKRTGHSSFYVEQGMSALGKSTMLGISGASFPVNGGGLFTFRVLRHNILKLSIAFPIWVEVRLFETLNCRKYHWANGRVRMRLVAQSQSLPVTQDHRKKTTQ